MLDVVIPVHNGADVIGKTMAALLTQRSTRAGRRHIIVVDDGSTDGTGNVVRAFGHPQVRLIRVPWRRGRANACNLGVASSRAVAVLLLDADCVPLADDLLCRHEQALVSGCDLSFGSITALGDDFWSHYARVVAQEREARVSLGDYLSMTSTNVAVRRTLFNCCGGFHEGYRHYGFEDRDLIASLFACEARPHYDAFATVLHDAQASVAGLCRKMEEAGRYTSGIFQRRQPDIYRAMKFSKVDVRTGPIPIRALPGFWAVFASPVEALAAELVCFRWLPAGWRLALVRFALALAFLRGTKAAVSATSHS